MYDLICVGFGPASLAIAIALKDANIQPPPRVLFLEKQSEFVWHAGMLLPGSKMQISFIKDLATLRNPRSEFTFLNYLHRNDRLVQFTNLGTFLPLREEYNRYMQWCAHHFNDIISYGEEVVKVYPNGNHFAANGVSSFSVSSKVDSKYMVRSARHVLIAVGGSPNIPQSFPQTHPQVIHSSKYSSSVSTVLSDTQGYYDIAVIGGGQSAAEIFSNLHDKFPNANIALFIKGSALRPSNDSPFVNEVFDPDRVDDTFSMPTDMRTAAIAEDRATNYGVVRLELLEHIYSEMYTQRLRNPDESSWRYRIFPRSTVDSAVVENDKVVLQVRNLRLERNPVTTRAFDAVITATGYRRNTHEDLLENAKFLYEGGYQKVTPVERDYRVKLDARKVSPDVGIWLQGCNENTHGLSDTLLSILPVRAGEIVNSIFLNPKSAKSATNAADIGHSLTDGANGHTHSIKLNGSNGVNGANGVSRAVNEIVNHNDAYNGMNRTNSAQPHSTGDWNTNGHVVNGQS